MRFPILCLLLIGMLSTQLSAQCPTGSEPPCMCETAEVLCSVSELNGFTGFLEPFLHPQDGPSPFCGPSTITHNPTWFAFIAWCEDITMDVNFTNCTTQPSGYGGAQLAVYTDCTFDDQVDCSETCVGANGTVTVDMNGLTIGESYYVMLDGCGGSICDYEISVSPLTCNEEIEDWADDLTEDLVVCIGETKDYIAESVLGATSWHWFIEDVEVDITDIPEYSVEWLTEGSYELCVDASNICVDVSDDPLPNCVMIFVADPNAGIIDAFDNPLCPKEIAEVEVTDYKNTPEYALYLIYVNSEEEVVKIVMGNYDEFTWPVCEEITVYSLNFPIGEEDIELPEIGDYYDSSECLSYCCDESSLVIQFVDTEKPEFDYRPSDIVVGCFYDLELMGLAAIEKLDVSDNCTEDDEVMGVETVMVDTCLGGTITREWVFMDDCGNEASHKQTITITEIPRINYLSQPRDTVMTVQEYDNYTIGNLAYDNGATGVCGQAGQSIPQIEEVRTGCTGSVTVRYMVTDSCGRQTAAMQIITLEEAVATRDTFINYCDQDELGSVNIFLSELGPLVANELVGYTLAFYRTSLDQDARINLIDFPINSSTLASDTIFTSVLDPLGCNSELVILVKVNPLPSLTLTETDETCLNDADGRIDIQLDSHGLPFTLLQGTDTVRTSSLVDLSPGTYPFLLEDSLGCYNEEIARIDFGIDVQLEILDVECDHNMTGTIPEDDSYAISFKAEGGMGSYDILFNGMTINSSFSYGTIDTIYSPASGVAGELTLIDIITGCTTNAVTEPLTPCSDDCELNIVSVTYNCNANGTFSDSSDDVYEFTVELSALNGSSSNQYTIYANGVSVGTATYGEVETFTRLADGSNLRLTFEDQDNASCFLIEEIIDPLTPCSNLCQIDIVNISVECTDSDTSDNNDDDIFSILFTVNGINTAQEYIITATGDLESYGEEATLGELLIQDGDFVLQVMDSDDSNCFAEVTVEPPSPCSMPCEVDLVSLDISDCFDNQTGMDDSDDIFFIDFNVAAVEGASNEYFLEDQDGNSYGPFAYGVDANEGPFPANGNNIVLTLIDSENGNCQLTETIFQFPCSLCNHTLAQIDTDNVILDCTNTTSTLRGEVDVEIEKYEWEGPNNYTADTREITISEPGDYILTATYLDGCVLVQRITIDISDDKPISNAGQNRILNCDTTVVTLNTLLSTQGADIIFNWLDSDGNVISEDAELLVTEPGIYGLLLIDNSNQCFSDISQVEVILMMNEPASVIYADPSPGNVLDCFVESITLSHEAESNTIYEWIIDGQAIQDDQLTIDSEQEIMLVAIDTISACSSDTTLVISDLTEYPIIDVDELHSIDCQTMTACVRYTTISSGNTVSSWYDADNNLLSNVDDQLCFSEAGSYIIEVMDLENNCVNADTFLVEGLELLTIDLPLSISFLNGDEQQLTPILNIPEDEIAAIEWETEAELSCYDCLTPMLLTAQDSSKVQVRMTNKEGCVASACLIVDLIKVPKVYIPNVLEINRDENFTIFSNPDVNTIDELYIYDRWGNIMFQNLSFPTNDPSQGWDGRTNNKEVEQGVYVYYISYRVDEVSEILAGTVTVIR